MQPSIEALRHSLESCGQSQVLKFWDELTPVEQTRLQRQIAAIQLPLTQRLIRDWVLNEPAVEHFTKIDPVKTLPTSDSKRQSDCEARDAGEEALRAGKVGLVLVAGGQGTRLGFDGPKGAYPIGPVTGKSIFAFHADKIHGIQRRYGCELPWYIMVGDTNENETRTFFEKHEYFGLPRDNIRLFKQRMMPCVNDDGKFMLDSPSSLATNPNGHGGVIPAMVENGVAKDAAERGVELISYFQVDNWAVKVADPYFLGHHLLNKGEISSKVCPKNIPRESVGVHCVCDGVYQVLEYTELDLYPQLLETDDAGKLLHSAGNTAIHVLSLNFIERVFERFDDFPWHCSHKIIPYIDSSGDRVVPDTPNGYKFETFVFDALRFAHHDPIPLEINRLGEYTPIKQLTGANSVEQARREMNEMWGGWLDAAGATVPRADDGSVAINIEISPRFALSEDEFVEQSAGMRWDVNADLAIGDDGSPTTGP